MTEPQAMTDEGRIVSVDALRGFDMFWIAGGGPVVVGLLKLLKDPVPGWLDRHFEHVEWEGFVAWDLIMPLFLFIVGVAMPLSLGRRLGLGEPRSRIYAKALRRAVLLWILGMISQGNLLDFRLETLRLYSNTLQAIAAGYLIATIALVELSVMKQALAAGVLLVVYWLLMVMVPVPGQGAGVLTPDGNLAIWIDRTLLGHFQDGTHYTWILSSLGFGATVLIGVLAGHLLRSRSSGRNKVLALVAAGLGCLLAGWLWSLAFPIIKHLWTSSMVLWAAGWSLLLLAMFYGVIDVLGFKRWAFPFRVIGANAIVAYMAPGLFNIGGISHHLFGGLSKHAGSAGDLLVAAGSVAILWCGLYYLFRKRTFVRV
jgi:predicted acyltransferase